MKKKNNDEEDVIESKWFGPAITKSEFYKKLPYDLCIHLRKEDSKNWVCIKKAFDFFNIPMNPTNKKIDQPYGAKFLMKWNKRLIDIFFSMADDLNVDPLKFTDERLDVICEIFEKCIDKKMIKKLSLSRDELIRKFDERIKIGITSIVE